MTTGRILVTGAGGKTGREVIDALLRRTIPVRALVRRSGRHAELPGAAADVEVVTADQRRPDELSAAMAGCAGVYAIAPNVTADEVEMGRALVRAAERTGVGRVVYHSVVDPFEPAMPHHADKGAVEQLLAASDLPVTVLRPNAYLQNLDGYLDAIRGGSYQVPYATDRVLGMVDLRDVAEVAAGTFREPGGGHDPSGAIWELSGADVSPEDVAATATGILGRPVVARRQDPDDWLAANVGLPEAARRRLHAMFLHYDRHGLPGDGGDVLRRLLGREPSTLVSYLRRRLGDTRDTAGA